MNFLSLGFFFLHVFLELTVFPKFSNTLLNPTYCYLISLFLMAFGYNLSFRKYRGGFLVVLFIATVFCYANIAIQQYTYNAPITYAGNFYWMAMFFLFNFTFILFGGLEGYKEFKTSSILPDLFRAIGILTLSNCMVFLFTMYHSKDAQKIKSFEFSHEQIDVKKIISHAIADYGFILNDFILLSIIKAFTSKTKKNIFIYGIIRKFCFFLSALVICYINYNSFACNFIYNKMNDYLPPPHNLIIYNTLAMDANTRMKLALIFLQYFVF